MPSLNMFSSPLLGKFRWVTLANTCANISQHMDVLADSFLKLTMLSPVHQEDVSHIELPPF